MAGSRRTDINVVFIAVHTQQVTSASNNWRTESLAEECFLINSFTTMGPPDSHRSGFLGVVSRCRMSLVLNAMGPSSSFVFSAILGKGVMISPSDRKNSLLESSSKSKLLVAFFIEEPHCFLWAPFFFAELVQGPGIRGGSAPSGDEELTSLELNVLSSTVVALLVMCYVAIFLMSANAESCGRYKSGCLCCCFSGPVCSAAKQAFQLSLILAFRVFLAAGYCLQPRNSNRQRDISQT